MMDPSRLTPRNTVSAPGCNCPARSLALRAHAQLARCQSERAQRERTLGEGLSQTEESLRQSRDEATALRRSREAVSFAVARAFRHRGGVAAAAEDRGGSVVQWCFWGWARVTRAGDGATDTRARRRAQEEELSRSQGLVRIAQSRAEAAEAELEKRR